MAFDSSHVTKIAKLSRIAVTEAEKEALVSEIGGILNWIEQLNEVDVTGIDPVASVSGEVLPLRKDVVTAGNQVDDVLANAPAREYDCFVVPKVIDQG
jgi:aspartyl-tRNA(Asn)/glutamyl-tRNA(Gln) amidotransferase subunit C